MCSAVGWRRLSPRIASPLYHIPLCAMPSTRGSGALVWGAGRGADRAPIGRSESRSRSFQPSHSLLLHRSGCRDAIIASATSDSVSSPVAIAAEISAASESKLAIRARRSRRLASRAPVSSSLDSFSVTLSGFTLQDSITGLSDHWRAVGLIIGE